MIRVILPLTSRGPGAEREQPRLGVDGPGRPERCLFSKQGGLPGGVGGRSARAFPFR